MDTMTVHERLDQERRRLLHSLDALGGEMSFDDDGAPAVEELSARDQHVADSGSDTYERERAIGLGDDLRAGLAEIDAALDRLARGEYGRCEACHELIDEERLDAVPATRYCVAHQDEWEHDSNGLLAAGRTTAPALARRSSARTASEEPVYTAVEFLADDDELGESGELGEVGAEDSAMHVTYE
ncbi:MAG: TraR/DksA family transcriptional regulator [Acidimicrobiia bacterium]